MLFIRRVFDSNIDLYKRTLFPVLFNHFVFNRILQIEICVFDLLHLFHFCSHIYFSFLRCHSRRWLAWVESIHAYLLAHRVLHSSAYLFQFEDLAWAFALSWLRLFLLWLIFFDMYVLLNFFHFPAWFWLVKASRWCQSVQLELRRVLLAWYFSPCSFLG